VDVRRFIRSASFWLCHLCQYGGWVCLSNERVKSRSRFKSQVLSCVPYVCLLARLQSA